MLLVGVDTCLLSSQPELFTLNSFVDISMLMGKQKVDPIAGWDEAVSQMEAWAMFCTVFL